MTPEQKDATAGIMAGVFRTKLEEYLTEKEMAEVDARNSEEDPKSTVCHSHDFCDANVFMNEAFEEVVGREPGVELKEDASLWNLAWAKFFVHSHYLGNLVD